MIFGRLFRRDSKTPAIAAAVYGAIVAQARKPALYTDFGVADTVDGRFEMVVLHMILVLDRLGAGDAEARAVSQAVFDLYCTDMDRSLREMGVGDLGVPKRMKAMTQRFYGRAAAYRAALAGGDHAALREALLRNVYNGPSGAAAALADYTLAQHRALASVSPGVVAAGDVSFTPFAQTGAVA